MKWTKEQEASIYESGTNILISAGAGSGKTAVLTERVLQKLKKGTDINRLLILTFTKNAATSMKNKIRKKIMGEQSLTGQLDLLDSSYITTFDSYAMSIVKEYGYLESLESNINITEESLMSVLKRNILDDLFTHYYTAKDSLFIKLINDFCLKNDEGLKENLLSIYNLLSLKYDKVAYLNNYFINYFTDSYFTFIEQEYLKLLEIKKNNIKDLLDDISYLAPGTYYSQLFTILNPLCLSHDYQDILLHAQVKLPSLPKNSEEALKKLKLSLTKALKELNNMLYPTLDIMKQEILKTKDYLQVIIDILIKLDQQVTTYKQEHNLFEFNDISCLAIKIVQNNKEVKQYLQNYFTEIMVDEYQDTNDLQETFINLIQNNNVYMVGDIKQSIYRFRNANPLIFKEKYEKYSHHEGGLKIDLNKNFRSRSEVINNINLIFNKVMSASLGGAAYSVSHQMVYGNHDYDLAKENNNIAILNYAYENKSKYSKEETEIFLIGQDIKNKINNHYQVFDKEKSTLRDVTYQDFAILIDRLSDYELFIKIFRYLDIPLTVYKENKITDDKIVSIFKNILNLVIKQHHNCYDTSYFHSYTSLARSFLFASSDQEIFNIVTTKQVNNTKIYHLINKINLNKSLQEIAFQILDLFHFQEKLLLIGEADLNLIKIEAFLSNITSLSEMGYHLEDYYTYLESLQDNALDIKYSLLKEENQNVQLMTIHGSKGLEYAICYFPHLYKKFNFSEIKDKIIYNDHLGFILPYLDGFYYETVLAKILSNYYLEEEISERIRLFYVALTRAKEQIILLLPNLDENKSLTNDYQKLKYRSFQDLITSISANLTNYIDQVDLTKVHLTKDYLRKEKPELKLSIEDNDQLQINHLQLAINHQNESFSKKISKLISKEEYHLLQEGTKIHEILENLDLKNPQLDSIPLNDYLKSKILSFLNSDLLKDITLSKIYQEYEFMYQEENTSYHGIIDLMLEYPDHIDIIDYKLKNIADSNYLKQLRGYQKYIMLISKKPINVYLYSLMDSTYQKVGDYHE